MIWKHYSGLWFALILLVVYVASVASILWWLGA